MWFDWVEENSAVIWLPSITHKHSLTFICNFWHSDSSYQSLATTTMLLNSPKQRWKCRSCPGKTSICRDAIRMDMKYWTILRNRSHGHFTNSYLHHTHKLAHPDWPMMKVKPRAPCSDRLAVSHIQPIMSIEFRALPNLVVTFRLS